VSEGDVSSKGTTSSGSAPRITIVDDDRDTREMLKLALEAEGYEVGVVSNGLRLISTLKVDQPDLVLLDIIMSWIDGFDLCRAIKKNPDFKEIPIIFISARAEPEDIRLGFDCGCVDYFTKPLDLTKLIARIREILGETPE
jgi:DNA-binding response OmpR family regulator